MALRLDLKPFEGFLINGALLRNGPRRTDFLIESHCKFLRESEVVRESQADTPAKRLCLTLQVLYLADDPADAEDLFVRQAAEILKAMPSAGPYILKIHDAIADRRFYAAIKRGREFLAYEETLS